MVWRLQSYVWCSVLSKAYKQTLIITGSDSITRHSLYWESPQFSLFVSYHGPLTWPHLPKTYFPISVPNIIYLCHLIVYVSFKNFCNCFTAIIMLLSFFCACNMPILYYVKSNKHWYLKSTKMCFKIFLYLALYRYSSVEFYLRWKHVLFSLRTINQHLICPIKLRKQTQKRPAEIH